ncbi:hypothetical protein BBJ28_00011004 [Nothophytophthora sp. Chile5]|nr:hypothetical protein BBJ28_00011004 [Nothophytophthora sp. Chile5]
MTFWALWSHSTYCVPAACTYCALSSALPNSKLHRGFPCVSGILKDEAITLLKKFYTSENPRGTSLLIMVLCCDSKKKRKKRTTEAVASSSDSESKAGGLE